MFTVSYKPMCLGVNKLGVKLDCFRATKRKFNGADLNNIFRCKVFKYFNFNIMETKNEYI